MTTRRSQIDVESANLTPNRIFEIERAASQARADHFGKLMTAAWSRLRNGFRHMSELFAFAQRMNSNARL